MDMLFIVDLLASSMRLATPLIFCALAGLLSERAGVIDIGLEGKMLFAAYGGGCRCSHQVTGAGHTGRHADGHGFISIFPAIGIEDIFQLDLRHVSHARQSR